MVILQPFPVLRGTYLGGKMPAPQEFGDLTLYIIRAENAVSLPWVVRYILVYTNLFPIPYPESISPPFAMSIKTLSKSEIVSSQGTRCNS